MKNMDVIKRLAPNYWLGYYGVYLVTLAFLCARHWRAITDWSDEGYLFTLAAIFTVSVGTALTAAVLAEGVGYMVLLIPRRIKKLKDEGRKEGLKRGIEQGLERGIEQGLERGIEQGMERGLERGRKEASARAGRAVARFRRGEITIDELERLTSEQD